MDNNKVVFISYCSRNRDFAAKLYWALQQAGVNVWMDAADIPPGHRWDRMIQQALENASHLVLVHTRESFESDNVWDEWSYCLQRDVPVIPLIFKDIGLPFRLARLHHVNFCTQSFEEAVAQLIKVLPCASQAPMPGIARNTIPQMRRSPANPFAHQEKENHEARYQTRHVDAPYDDPPRRNIRDERSGRDPFRNELTAPDIYGEDLIEAAEDFVDTRFHNRLQPLSDLSQHTMTDLLPTPPLNEFDTEFDEDETFPFDCIDTTIDDDTLWQGQ